MNGATVVQKLGPENPVAQSASLMGGDTKQHCWLATPPVGWCLWMTLMDHHDLLILLSFPLCSDLLLGEIYFFGPKKL